MIEVACTVALLIVAGFTIVAVFGGNNIKHHESTREVDDVQD